MSSQQFCKDINAVMPAVSLFIACLTLVIAIIVALPIAIAFFSAVAGIVAFGLSLIAFVWIIGSLLKIGSGAVEAVGNVYGRKATQYASEYVRYRAQDRAAKHHTSPDADDTVILGNAQRKRAQYQQRQPSRAKMPVKNNRVKREKTYVLMAGMR